MKVYNSKKSQKLRDQVFCRIFDDNFGLSENESIDEDDNGICSTWEEQNQSQSRTFDEQGGGTQLTFWQERLYLRRGYECERVF